MVSHGECVHRGGGGGPHTPGFVSASSIVAAPHGSLSLSPVWGGIPPPVLSHTVSLQLVVKQRWEEFETPNGQLFFFPLNLFFSKKPKENLLNCFMCTLRSVFYCIIACCCVLSQWQKVIEELCSNCKLLVYYLQALNGPKIECGRWRHHILSQHHISDVEETMWQTSQLSKWRLVIITTWWHVFASTTLYIQYTVVR